MSFVGVGMGIGGLASIGGAIIGSNAASSAADKQAEAAREATALQEKMFNQQRADAEPWRQGGLSAMYGNGGLFRKVGGGTGGYRDPGAINAAKDKYFQEKLGAWEKAKQEALAKAPGFTRDQVAAQLAEQDAKVRGQIESAWSASPEAQGGISSDQYEVDPELTRRFGLSDFQQDPGYEFRMKEGQKALERSAAARGGLNSGATLKATARYGQDLASNEYQNAYNRFTNDQSNRFNRLSALAGSGQAANQQIGQAGMNYANQAGNNMMGAANAQAAAGIAGANAWSNGLSGFGQSVMNYGANQQQQSWMDKNLAMQQERNDILRKGIK